MSAFEPRNLSDRLAADFSFANVLNQRRDALVIRLNVAPAQTVIVKLWVRPGIRGLVRRVTRTSSAIREWRTLDRLHRTGASVPKPFLYTRVGAFAAPYTDALFVEDLGTCEMALEYVKPLLRNAQYDLIEKLENEVIALTHAILQAGIIDSDHSFVNTVVTSSGKPVRIDFELAKRVYIPSLAVGLYGEMIGRLVGTYALALQPDVRRVVPFAQRLRDCIQPPARVLKRARAFAENMLEIQRRDTAIDTRINLNW